MAQKIKEYLDGEGVSYQVLAHERAFTAQGVAAALHVRGREFAKPVIVRAKDGRLAMVVVPGPRHVDLRKLEDLLGAQVQLAREEEFAPLFAGCELGAEPPFGVLYGLPLYADESLREDEEIVFNAGTHTEAIRMRYRDFERLARPTVASLSTGH